jgi:hypothetical protein
MALHRSRAIHPLRAALGLARTARAHWRESQRFHEKQWRYRFNPGLLEREQARAETAPNVSSCPQLEMSADGLDAAAASGHLRRLGCLLVRGNGQMRAAVAEYREFLDRVGYTKIGIPRGGALWFKGEDGFRFHMHRLVQKQFYELCRQYLDSAVLLSSCETSASIRTVARAETGLVPFHQDISPVAIERALTFWIAIDPDDIGEKAPGLRFIASTKSRRSRIMSRNTETHELTKPGLNSDEFFWTPKINAGDVMIFDGYAPHASYSHDAMTLPRTSVDLRISRFDAQQAISYLKAGHGSLIFDREEMIAPTGRIADAPPEFSYDLTRVASPTLREAVAPMVG